MESRTATAEQMVKEMEAQRGYISPAHRFMAAHDPEFIDAYNRLAGLAFLYGDRDDGSHALPAKYREMVVCAILAHRGSAEGVANHAKRAMACGATERELLEAFEATVIPGGAPTFLTGVQGLILARERAGQP